MPAPERDLDRARGRGGSTVSEDVADKLRRWRYVRSTILWLLLSGCVALGHYGLYALPAGSDSSWRRSLQISGLLFAFGVWLGVVIFGEEDAWFPRFRRILNAVLLAGLVVLGAWLFATPSITLLSFVAGASALLGYFAEKWLPYLQ